MVGASGTRTSVHQHVESPALPLCLWMLIWLFASIEKHMVIYDTECPYWDKESLNNTKSISSSFFMTITVMYLSLQHSSLKEILGKTCITGSVHKSSFSWSFDLCRAISGLQDPWINPPHHLYSSPNERDTGREERKVMCSFMCNVACDNPQMKESGRKEREVMCACAM